MLVSDMELIKTFEEFISERYASLEIKFLNQTSAHLSKNYSAMRKFCLAEWQKALAEAIKLQQSEENICSYMSVSLMNTSVLEGEPKFQVDFYNQEWVYGESFCRYKFSADFLFKYWKDFVFEVQDDNFYLRSNFGKAEIQSLFFGTVDKLAFMFACFTKYFAYQLSYSNEFDDIKRTESFYLTCGVYLDWQNRVAADLPEIDLLNPEANQQTTYRPYNNKILRGKSFHDIDLQSGNFENCLFHNFTFENVSLVDAIFLQCRFISVTFQNVKFAGCTFFECYLKDCTFKNCSSDSADVRENNDEYFAPMLLYHCFALGRKDINCNFERSKIIDVVEKE